MQAARYAARRTSGQVRKASDVATGDTITISGQNSLTADELAEALALKDACDSAERLDLKLGYGAAEPEKATYPTVFLARSGQRLVGYCSLDGDATTAELCGMVHPDWRRHRLGVRLFESARASFRRAGGGQLFAICEDGSASGHAFLRMLAAQRAFSEHRMVWQGGAHAPAPLSDQSRAFVVERARPEDYQALAAALAHAFDHAEERLLADLTNAAATASEQVYAARLNGAIIGGFRLSRMPDSTGIYAFGIDPAQQRKGWGRRMLAQACALGQQNPEHLEQRGQRVTLEVDTENAPAIALYRASGFERVTTYGYYIFSPTLLAVGLNLDTSDDADEG
jgi:ribosomal protein S18 acetylase RimI-like enzyme